ncbi:2'-5' RNA ligase family protein [Dyadobacter sandarakinus]|uniref:2'-5' RNA ligase family protein n=1 Tax=Dyadobacter sandarakinus TaxID=2747268 RepID=A0ABX7I1X3_9BACT|nr:2'-5' RNA ligase family protein [Dyadobacter sandarakinus]QRR00077.1 2'-5' RNA ligase family protein [Dyadobacter sandarakinus]
MEQAHTMPREEARPPLVATLSIDPSVQEYFNELRRTYFPPERNYLDAHLTLFHALPDEPGIREELQRVARQQPSFDAVAEQIVSLGYGTAFKIVAPALPALHQQLQKHWHDALTNQDRQKRNFHITIQNKVEPARAKALQAELGHAFKPFSFAVTGFRLWRYLGGPWEYLESYDFL